MKLWILLPRCASRKTFDGYGGPWDPWYDKAFGFVVRAESAKQARDFANEAHGDEGLVWADPNLSSCRELKPEGNAGIVMKDFAAA